MLILMVCLNGYLTVVLWLLFTRQLHDSLDGLPNWLSKFLSPWLLCTRQLCGSRNGYLNCCPMIAVYKAATWFSGWFACMVI
jgi:hypothetical protein